MFIVAVKLNLFYFFCDFRYCKGEKLTLVPIGTGPLAVDLHKITKSFAVHRRHK